MEYFSILPKEELIISEIYSLHYFENCKNYFFPGECHNFWELLYVDRGECTVHTDSRIEDDYMVQGELIFHKPNEFHSFYANNIMAHNIGVISFGTPSPAMAFFETNPLHIINRQGQGIIGHILGEARRCFQDPLGIPSLPQLRRNENAPFGGEQIIKILLEILLLGIYRGEFSFGSKKDPSSGEKKLEGIYVEKTIAFLKSHVREKISLEDVCKSLTISRSQLQKVFHRQTGRSVMRYLTELRVEEAKYLIRSRTFNFTEISEQLQYNTVHHFSRQFKEVSGMSPSEYLASIRAIIELSERTYHQGDSAGYTTPL